MIALHYYRRIWLIGFLLIIVVSACHTLSLPERILYYHQPAGYFEEALPLGNGRIGVTVYGGVKTEQILLNEETLWAGGPVDPAMNPTAYEHLPAVRRALFQGDYKEADRLVRKIQGKFSESYAPLGDLFIEMNHDSVYSDYNRELDLRRALASVQYRVGDVHYTREVFVSHPHQVLAIHLKADRKGALGFTMRQRSQLRYRVKTEDGHLIMDGQAPVHAEPSYRGDMKNAIVYDEKNGMRFRVLARIVDSDGKINTGRDHLTVSDASEAVILVSIATSFNGFENNPGIQGKDEKVLSEKHLDKAAARTFRDLRKAHVSDFSSYFQRVSLDLGSDTDPDLPTNERLQRYTKGEPDNDLEALYFQFGRYLLISSSRPGTQPANLQGIWNGNMNPNWDSKYTTNINTEMNYWPAEVGNLSEFAQPLFQMIRELTDQGRDVAREHYGKKGWVFHQNTDLWRVAAPMDGAQWGTFNAGGAWLWTHLWEHYLFTEDRKFLRKVYPIMKGSVNFFLDFLVEHPERGWLVTNPSTSPENFPGRPGNYERFEDEIPDYYTPGITICAGSTIDMQILNDLFGYTAEASKILEIDADFRKQVLETRGRLAPMQIGEKGDLQEWLEDWEQKEKSHRHISNLYGLFPGNQVSVRRTPNFAEAAKIVLNQRGLTGNGWASACKMGCWARLYDAEKAMDNLVYCMHHYTTNSLYSICSRYPQVDGLFGLSAAIAEMLLQSHEGEIHLLPAVPGSWPMGSIKGLRARGGFELDMTWEDKLKEVVVHSINGNVCRIRYGERQAKFDMEPGQRLTLNGHLEIQ